MFLQTTNSAATSAVQLLMSKREQDIHRREWQQPTTDCEDNHIENTASIMVNLATLKTPLHADHDGNNVRGRVHVVSFGTVVIREHRLCLGNNPACSSGPPTAIEWKTHRSLKLSVDEYEDLIHTSTIERRSRKDLVMPRKVREEMLRRRGYSRKEILHATQENVRLQREHLKSRERYMVRKKVVGLVQGALSIFRRSNKVNVNNCNHHLPGSFVPACEALSRTGL